jgi:soluble lytic murein transglycosylase
MQGMSRVTRVLIFGLGLGLLWPAWLAGRAARARSQDAELERLAAALRTETRKKEAAYAALKKFALSNEHRAEGARAALALGYYDYARKQYVPALAWLVRAERDPLLRDYARYWAALTERAVGRQKEALARLESLRRDFPRTVLKDALLVEAAQAALALRKPQLAADFLAAHSARDSDPAVMMLRAEALEKTKQPADAAAVYARLFYEFPLSDEAKLAGTRLTSLRRSLGPKAPPIPDSQKLARADAFFGANRCREARLEYAKLIPQLRGPLREAAELRSARCRVNLGAHPKLLASLLVEDSEVDAERLYALSQAYRSAQQEAPMLAAIELLAARYPRSPWTDEALLAGGNHFWVQLDRKRAAEFYRRQLSQFPNGKNTLTANWRLAWHAYMHIPEEAAARLEEHLRRFPGTPYTVNALYWLGRCAERAGDAARVRGFYQKAAERFPQTYYGLQSAERLRVLGPGTAVAVDVFAFIPEPPPAPPFEQALTPAAEERRQRAQALQAIGFPAAAEQELRAGYAESRSPRLLIEAAQAAHEANRYGAGILAARQAVPQLEARRLEELPEEVWRAVYPIAYAPSITASAERAGVDPMLVAGLIRQESVFQRDAVSRAGAVGLMQVLPTTGRLVARQQKLRYSRAKLFDPEFNLRLGTGHLADLVNSLGSLEAALAAYNAGVHRVAAWTAGQKYAEPAEFVESIPFTETREYVQIVMRNAEIYRGLYTGARIAGAGK